MPFALPGSLTPSKVSTFKECALAFRLSAIDRLPEPTTVQAFKGTVVHRALELLMWEEQAGGRTPAAAFGKLERALAELLAGPEGLSLNLHRQALDELEDDVRQLLDNYFTLEDPNSVRVIGTEIRLEVEIDGAIRMRGIIDRLELDAAGELVVTDYKTGRAPGQSQEQSRLGGVHFYAFLCERVLGKLPARAQLLHLREPVVITSTPTEQTVTALERQATAIWGAVQRACQSEDFRPKPGPLCSWCGYHAYCPARGGDLSLLNAARDKGRSKPEGVQLPLLPV